jgi:hypothetical protein
MPMPTPAAIGKIQPRNTPRSTAPCLQWPRNEEIEVGTITASEVPTQRGIRISSGTP